MRDEDLLDNVLNNRFYCKIQMSFRSYCDIDIAMFMGHKLDKEKIQNFSSLFRYFVDFKIQILLLFWNYRFY